MAYWVMALISLVILWMMVPGDIGSNEQALAMVIVPSLVGGIITFIVGETYGDHSERRHGRGEDA
jgi:hypothetical protein